MLPASSNAKAVAAAGRASWGPVPGVARAGRIVTDRVRGRCCGGSMGREGVPRVRAGCEKHPPRRIGTRNAGRWRQVAGNPDPAAPAPGTGATPAAPVSGHPPPPRRCPGTPPDHPRACFRVGVPRPGGAGFRAAARPGHGRQLLAGESGGVAGSGVAGMFMAFPGVRRPGWMPGNWGLLAVHPVARLGGGQPWVAPMPGANAGRVAHEASPLVTLLRPSAGRGRHPGAPSTAAQGFGP